MGLAWAGDRAHCSRARYSESLRANRDRLSHLSCRGEGWYGTGVVAHLRPEPRRYRADAVGAGPDRSAISQPSNRRLVDGAPDTAPVLGFVLDLGGHHPGGLSGGHGVGVAEPWPRALDHRRSSHRVVVGLACGEPGAGGAAGGRGGGLGDAPRARTERPHRRTRPVPPVLEAEHRTVGLRFGGEPGRVRLSEPAARTTS